MSAEQQAGMPEPQSAGDELRARERWVLFLSGPTIWFAHFMLVYLLAEVLCKPLRDIDVALAGLPLVSFLTVVATLVAAGATLWFSRRSHTEWRRATREEPDEVSPYSGAGHSGSLVLGGFLLGLLFFVAVLFTGAPALFLAPC